MRRDRLRIYFDGGCRPNPGAMETAVVARGRAQINSARGIGGSIDAEWLALIDAATLAVSLGASDVALIGDARTVIEQAAGRWPCRTATLAAYRARYAEIAAAIPRVVLRHVGRAQNLAGIALAQRYR